MTFNVPGVVLICSCFLLPNLISSAEPALACCPCCAQLLLCPPPASPTDRDFLVFPITLQPPTMAFLIYSCAFLERCGHRTAKTRESSPQHTARVWMFPELAALPCSLVALLGMAELWKWMETHPGFVSSVPVQGGFHLSVCLSVSCREAPGTYTC